MSPMILLETRDLIKRYGDAVVLDKVNLEVEEGDFLALVGPNGAGKTTLLRIMGAIERPTSGKIYYKGEIVRGAEALRRASTMVFQRAVVFSGSVYENVAYGLRLRGLSKGEVDRRVGEALRQVGLEGFERRNAGKLSGGEQQRVSLARAIALDVELLLLDEPTANLDPRSSAIMERIISWINSERRVTTVLATHNLSQAENLSGKVALLMDGKLTQMGDADQLLRNPLGPMRSFVKRENIFLGEAVPEGDGTTSIVLQNDLKVVAATPMRGKVIARVHPEDIIVSLSPIASSARNVLRGEVTGITDRGGCVMLTVNAGKEFVVRITHKSFREMGLTLGTSVYLVFKASAVEVM